MTQSAAAIARTEDTEILAEFLPVASQIEHFVSGATSGSALFHALYDEILDEAVPQRLLDVVRRR